MQDKIQGTIDEAIKAAQAQEAAREQQRQGEQGEPEDLLVFDELSCSSQQGGRFIMYRSDIHSQELRRPIITKLRASGYTDFKLNKRKLRDE
jgi:hypothetical protein